MSNLETLDKHRSDGAAAPADDAETRFAAIASVHLADAAVEDGRMFGSPGLKVGGKVFALLVKGRLVVKLPAARVQALVRTGDGTPFDPGHGRVMKEWVCVGSEAAADWAGIVEEAKAFVGGP